MSKTPRTDKVKKTALTERNYDKIECVPVELSYRLERELAEARTEIEHWRGECRDLVRKAHEMRAEIDYFQTLIDLQHKRTVEADKLWQAAHNQPDVWPDLGMLIEWLLLRLKNQETIIEANRATIKDKDALIEQMREALKTVVSSALPSGPLWYGSAEIKKAVAALEAAERITDHRGEFNEMVKAASDLLGYLEKAIAADEVDIAGTDIGAAGARDRLEKLAAAVKAAERGE